MPERLPMVLPPGELAAYVERVAALWESVGDFARAIWIRSQTQEIQAVLERGGWWPEVFGL